MFRRKKQHYRVTDSRFMLMGLASLADARLYARSESWVKTGAVFYVWDGDALVTAYYNGRESSYTRPVNRDTRVKVTVHA